MRAILTILAFLAAAPLAAQPAGCSGSASQMEMNMCAGVNFQAADARLNAVYREVTARLDGAKSARRKLVAAQRAWIAFRDAECSYVTSGTEGGSINSMLYTQCMTGMTDKRTDELRAQLTCEEGDLMCPVPPK